MSIRHTPPISLCIIAIAMIFSLTGLHAQQLPLISALNNQNPLFRQITNDIRDFHLYEAGNGTAPRLMIYRYQVSEGDSLFSLAAKLNLPQASLATLNRLDNPVLPTAGNMVFIPNIPGIFIPDEPDSDFEKLLASRIRESGEIELSERFFLPDGNGGRSGWRFIIAGDFTGLERRAFLQVLFRDPLPSGYISSSYGMRISPITGKTQFHYGVDLVAPEGSEVVSTADGVVVETGYDDLYGNYVRIEHDGGYTSMYAHLSSISVIVEESVRNGGVIGRVGSTGLSTGAHLHFEITYLGRNRDPIAYIRR